MIALAADALDANRVGRLTDVQRKNLRAESRGLRKNELSFAGILIVLGLVVWLAEGPPKYATIKPLLGIGFLIIAGFLLVRAFLGADSVTADLRAGRVDSVEGAVTKWANTVHSQHGHSSTSYYVQVERVRAETGAGFYKDVPEAGIVRMFYLPRSHQLVNLEQLADQPLPEGALNDPRLAIKDAKQAILGGLLGDPVKEAHARAELAAIGHAMQGQFGPDGAPPAPAARDPRPLAQAIVDTWRNPMMTLVFAADGTASMTTSLGGMQRQGRWSVDAAERLVTDVAGSTEPVDAWISNGRLTVVMGRQSLSFDRVG